jgi:hypothetical protein
MMNRLQTVLSVASCGSTNGLLTIIRASLQQLQR